MSKKRRKTVDRTVWCDRGFLTIFYGFCPDESSWNAQMKRMKVDVKKHPYPTSAGRCTTFQKDGAVCCIVTIGDDIDGRCPTGIMGLLVHESVHVYQTALDDMGEEKASPEMEAYAVQFIFLRLLDAYAKLRGKKLLRK
jgi:hypothetical protein